MDDFQILDKLRKNTDDEKLMEMIVNLFIFELEGKDHWKAKYKKYIEEYMGEV